MKIEYETLKKLTNECPEVRLRSLNQVHSKLKRAFDVNESLELDSRFLCKQLYRWFNLRPIKTLVEPLQVLQLLLCSEYGDDVIKQVGLARMRRENEKIRALLTSNEGERGKGLDVLSAIENKLRVLEQRNNSENLINGINTMQISNVSSIESTCTTPENVAFSFCAPLGDINANVTSSISSINICREHYEAPWSKVSPADFKVMKLIAEELANPNISAAKLENTLNHLQITMPDYPADYFLQSPHVFLNVLKLLDKVRILAYSHDMLIETMSKYLTQLMRCLEQRSNISTYATPNAELATIGATQLKVSKAIELVLEQCLDQLNEQLLDHWKEQIKLVELIVLAFRISDLEGLVVSETHIHKMNRMCEQLKLVIENSEHFTLQRLKYLLLTGLLHHILEQNAKLYLPKRQESNTLEPLLRDYPFKYKFPEHYKRLANFLCSDNGGLKDECEKLECIDDDFQLAVQLLEHPKHAEQSMIKLGLKVCYTLDHLGSIELGKTLFNAIVTLKVEYLKSAALKEDALKLLHALLNLKNAGIRAEMYDNLAKVIKGHIMVIANGGRFYSEIENAAFYAQHIIGVPLDCKILLNIIVECYSGNSAIGADLTNMLVSLLQIHYLFDVHWQTLLQILLPLLPYLHCLANAPLLDKQLLRCYNPDDKILNLSAMLQGNIRFLFHADERLREESLTRILYMVGSREDASFYLPDTRRIHTALANDICVIEPPREMSNIFVTSDSSPSDIAEVLRGLYAIFDQTDVEPSIRKSALLQLQMLSQDWQTARRMLDDGVENLVALVLSSSLQIRSQCDYQENCKPAISIFTRLLLLDAQLRIQFKDDIMLQVLLLRALFLLPTDMQIRQDASLCLFLLVFPFNYDIQPPTHKTSAIINASELLSTLKVPFKFKTISPQAELAPSEANEVQLSYIFKEPQEQTLYLRHLIHFKVGNTTKVCGDLQMTKWDFSLANATCPNYCMGRFLLAFQNSTDSKKLTNVCAMLELILTLLVHLKQEAQVSDELVLNLCIALNKTLQVLPACGSDYQSFEQLVELAAICIDAGHTSMQFIKLLTETLHADPHHALFQLLQNQDTPLRLYSKVSILLTKVAKLRENPTVILFNEQLFSFTMENIKLFFKQRDFLRVRCLLLQLVQLASLNLGCSDTYLMTSYDRVIRMSVTLKTYTQTGAQWHRCCLLLLERLSRQMIVKSDILKLAGPAIKFISGLCSHSDTEVRNLAWIHLLTFAKCKDHAEPRIVGANLLVSELSYLPGGLLACCLSTLLDANEAIIVRCCAGNLFAMLLSYASIDAAFVADLLERHTFFTSAQKTLQDFTSSPKLPSRQNSCSQRDYINSDIVRCYCSMVSSLIRLQPIFVQQLCKQPFMLRVVEVLKRPVDELTASYYKMAAEICNLCMQCKSEHLDFLQRNIFRDQSWLRNYFRLLEQSQKFPLPYELAKILQTLQLLCLDEIVWASFSEKLSNAPHVLTGIFMNFFQLDQVNSQVQHVGLNTLIVLLTSLTGSTKEQHRFVAVLENVPIADAQQKSTGAELIFKSLYGIWKLQYPIKSHRFDSPPSDNQKLINKTLSQLLQYSPQSQCAAKQVGFLEQILGILKSFFDELNMPSTNFIRRYGERRKTAVLANIQELLMIILHWQSSADGMCINKKSLAQTFSTIMSRTWYWSVHSVELKLLVLRVCARATEHSLLVCEQFSNADDASNFRIQSSGSSPRESKVSMLGLILEFIYNESTKVKAPSMDNMPIIEAGMHNIITCCACSDARRSIAKKNLHEIFQTLSSNKNLQSRSDVLLIWLIFWENLTRHKDSQQVRCLDLFSNHIQVFSQGSQVRRYCLLILRNYSFFPANSACLFNSKEFLIAIDQILSENLIDPEEYRDLEEACIVVVMTWRLLANSVKNVALLRATKLAKKFIMLHDQIGILKSTDPLKFNSLPQAKSLKKYLRCVVHYLKQT